MATNKSVETQDDDVFDIDLDSAPERPAAPPARVRIGGQTWTIQPPDAGLVMEIEEAQTTARTLQLLFDDQWADVRPLLDSKSPEDLLKLVTDLGDRFGFSQQAMMDRAAPNRAARRQRRSSARR